MTSVTTTPSVHDPGSAKDHWSSQAYSTSASFVPALTKTVVSYLNPQANDRILDIGCGDGVFTSYFADSVSLVLGLDASPKMIEAANKEYSSDHVMFKVQDVTKLEQALDSGQVQGKGTWDKVCSNAALHWILCDPSTRESVLRAVALALHPGGQFVFEMGGHGNVAEIHGTFISALVHAGVPIVEARRACPWFFPSEDWMRSALDKCGFEILALETEYRPTKMTEKEGGGLEGWVRLMGAQLLEHVAEKKRHDVVKECCEVLQTVCGREEGGVYLGYVRLRGIAKKK